MNALRLSLGTIVLVVALLAAQAVGAATPPAGTLTAPDEGTAQVSWSGEAPPGAVGPEYSLCETPGVADRFDLTVALPSGNFFDTHDAFLEIRIDWDPRAPNDALNDLVLYVVPPQGDPVFSDGGTSTETVTLPNPDPGLYKVYTCPFASATLQPYLGVARLDVTNRVVESNPPSTPTDVKFGPIVTVDPQRDVAEPSLRVDGHNNEYACGPFGASRGAEYLQKSEDRGDTFRILGLPPEGRIAPGGGGDCEIAVAPQVNGSGFYNLAYTGLEALVNFSTSRSTDEGRTFVGTPVSESPVVVDRQWMDSTGTSTVYLTYRQIPLGSYLQRSTDGGLTYSISTLPVISQISISGNLVIDNRDPTGNTVFIVHTAGNEVRVARVTNANLPTPTSVIKTVVNATGDPSSIFPALAQDTAGNLYAVWTEAGTYNAFYSFSTNGGDTWSPKVQVNRDNLNSTVLPWIDAGSPGRIAISFYGTAVDGNPELGTFRGPWDVYVNTSTNAMDANPAMGQTKVTTHPIHWDSICLSGLACSTTGGDRTLLDLFQVKHDSDGSIRMAYNESNKRSGDAAGPIAIVTFSKQIAGTGLFASPSPVPADSRPVVDVARTDPAGDALYPFSFFPAASTPPTFRTPYPALDVTSLTAGYDSSPGVKFTMKLSDLSAGALTNAQAVLGSNLLFVVRFFSGYEAHAAVASYTGTGFQFGFTDLALSPDGKLEIYPPTTPIPGSVNQVTGEITMTVPYSMIPQVDVASPPQNPPNERSGSSPGDRIFEVTAFTFGNPSGSPATQTFLNQGDSSYSFDTILQDASCQGRVTLAGTPGNDTLNGTPGPDVIIGGAGDDTINGLGGNDRICGGPGADTISGNEGSDFIDPGPDNDSVSGGDGYDVLDYTSAPAAVTVNLVAGTATGGSGSDGLSGLEAVLGSAFNDTLTGDGARNNLFGQGGNDILSGGLGADGIDPGPGNDTVSGDGGFDVVSYFFRTATVTVTLANSGASTGNGEAGESDSISSDVEGAQGGAGNDTLTGSNGDNNLFGQGGDDTLNGQGGADGLDPGLGQDILNGGPGFDIASYFFRAAAVTLTLDNAANDGQSGENDNIGPTGDVEGLQGGRGNDTLTGNTAVNRLNGQNGDDSITSRDSPKAADTVACGLGTDTVAADDLDVFDPSPASTACENVTVTS